MVDNSNIEKLTELFFPGKFIFVQIWAKRTQNDSKIGFYGLFKKFCYVSFSWKYSKVKTNIVIDISTKLLAKFWVSKFEPKCCQPIKLQDSLKCNIVRKS